MNESCFDITSKIVYFPVRHHSPAVSFHLIKAMKMYCPDCVLIEGPSDADDLIPYLADEGTKPPVCIYSSYDDRAGAVSEDKEKYRAYYPFLAYSPEFTAICEAKKRGIPAHFIDMPYPLMLTMFGLRDNEKQSEILGDESADYYALAAEKSGCRCFSEFWERGFEMTLQSDTEEFIASVYSLGKYMRELSPAGEKNLCREAYMRDKISSYAKEFKRIIVVTGAYHTKGLIRDIGKVKFGKYSKADSANYLMPYTFAETDSRSGYGAGIPFPAFYSSVWSKISGGAEEPYLRTAAEYIVDTARYARDKRQPVSIPDETEALYMTENLAALRGIPEPGAYELIDGVRSAFVKGDVTTAASFELDYLYRRMSGMGAGELNLSEDGSGNIVPPCVADFRALCRKYRLNAGTIVRQTTVLDVVKNPAHYEKSCFLHRMEYMKTNFCRCESGPDHVNGKDTSLIREHWSYRFSTAVETALTDLSVYGGSVETICRNLLARDNRDMTAASEAGSYLLNLFVTGFSDSENMLGKALETVRNDLDFSSQCGFLSKANRLIILQKSIKKKADKNILALLKISFDTAVCEIPNVCAASEDEAEGICSGLRLLYSLAGEYGNILSKNELMKEVSAAAENARSSPMVYGVCLALCGRAKLISEEEYGERIRSFLLSADGESSAGFISGVILAGRDIIFTNRSVLVSIDEAIKRMDRDKFYEVLPQLRRAFTAFLPSETSRISKGIAELYGINAGELSGSTVFSAKEIRLASARDMRALEMLKKYGLYGGEQP